jgi:hypothetical protein
VLNRQMHDEGAGGIEEVMGNFTRNPPHPKLVS